MDRILVLYGTTEGHTEMIATVVGNTLAARGFDVDVMQAGTIDPRPSDYDGIIVAASVHHGTYQMAVANWIGAYIDELSAKPSAFVSASLGAARRDGKAMAEVYAVVHRFIDPLGWRPTMIKTVAGALRYARYNLLKRWVMTRFAGDSGADIDASRDYDYTNWTDLRVFAEEFGQCVANAKHRNNRLAAT